MCIRDRDYSVGHPSINKSGDTMYFASDMPGGFGESDIYVAVSYTHLRAHETVLDLVCRLLLEKKKNLSTYSTSRDMNLT